MATNRKSVRKIARKPHQRFDPTIKARAVKTLFANPGAGPQIAEQLGTQPAVIYRWAQDARFGGKEGGISGRAQEFAPAPTSRKSAKRAAKSTRKVSRKRA